MTTDRLHLQKKGDTWWYVRRTPLSLYLVNPEYDSKYIWINTNTTKLAEAKTFRTLQDARINLDIDALKAYGQGREAKQKYLSDLYRTIQSQISNNLIEMHDHEGNQFHEAESIDDGLDLDHLQTTDPERFQAIVNVLSERHTGRKGLSLKETYKHYKAENPTLKHRTIEKHKVAVQQFLATIQRQDIRLSDLNRKFIRQNFQQNAASAFSPNQINTILQCLSRICSCSIVEEELGDTFRNPFKGITPLKTQSEQFQLFTESQLHKLFSTIESLDFTDRRTIECHLALSMIWTTGARREEICSLKTSNILTDSKGIMYFEIKEGKTRSSTRNITIHKSLIDKVIEQLNYAKSLNSSNLFFTTFKSQRVDMKHGEFLGRWFNVQKNQALPGLGPLYSIHSFRRHMATMFEASAVREELAAWILGHKRIYSLTYGLYSKGPPTSHIYDAVNLQKPMLSTEFRIDNHDHPHDHPHLNS
jgi:integrase